MFSMKPVPAKAQWPRGSPQAKVAPAMLATLVRLRRCAGRRVGLQEHVDAHARQQRRLAGQIDDDLEHVDDRSACADRAGRSGSAPAPAPREATLPSKSLPGKASERMIAAWPTRSLPMSRSSISALTRSEDRSPMTTSTFSGEGVAVSPALALTCRTVPGEAALMRVRSSAASACGEIGAGSGQRHLGTGRRGQPVDGERLAQIGARLIEPLLGLVDGIARLLDVGFRALAAAARLVGAVELVAVLHELPLGVGHLVLGGSAILRRLAGGRLGVVALALAHGRLGKRGIDAADELLVVEAHQEIAGGNLVVEGRPAPRRRGPAPARRSAPRRRSARRAPRPRPPSRSWAPPSAWPCASDLGAVGAALALSTAGLALNVCGT